MEFKKLFITFFLTITLTGCSAIHNRSSLKNQSPYEKGFRDGVSYNVEGIVEKLNGNDFPYAGTWSQPIVQEVRVPAHIREGVFYPESTQIVLIVPGEWKKNQAFPINSKQKENDKNEDTLQNINFNAVDITTLPKRYTSSGSADKQQ